ncbi:hemerythrin domain-containing protein [Consotaella salsifontis]|uniref:hemerythrin domain-containing protein n=1 Tax=Consotaella salsifontis TaxID=1365950 RepID=UPI000999ED90|nr:hemerythrin domain-containing protein [Consotaella salsifontis]
MALFYWNAGIETGNNTIDQQHRRLFAMTNELAELIADGEKLPEIKTLIGRLEEYARGHFCNEERLMACSALSAREQERHTCAHRVFRQRIRKIAEAPEIESEEAANCCP